MKKWLSGIGLAAGLVLAGTQAWTTGGPSCGDTAGPGGTDIPCECGDTVTTNTNLTGSDPVVSKNPDGVPPDVDFNCSDD